MVMAARPIYEALGVHWTMTLLGCIAVRLVSLPLLLKRYGLKLGERSGYAADRFNHLKDCIYYYYH
jgi:DHA1 family multidrug resistance protein-like MFS transporter